ncbi:hypothetical protein L210DRAFT_3524067 [Boletus edulis BED1]|uniref:Fungal-type protein kinase domain-containing protein n=1 Tax=Boletus edulis BED1 TaxID=1328754 RepID=A0AAD4GJT3_BOLED|nr:hypothetical protein L210DRAFT_3524067 [Boletus edulis BED1]
MLFAYGMSLYSKPFDMDKEPILLSRLSSLLGFNPLMLPDIRGNHRLELGGTLYDVLRRTWVRSISMDGRGTKVPLCRNPRDPTQFFALKDCWLPCDGPNDIINNEALTLRKPKPMTDELRQNFGEPDKLDIFRYCRVTRGTEWDYETHLPGIPILKHTEIATFPHGLDGEYQDDTTEAITRRFSKHVDMECRIHIRTLSKTCGVSLPWFPCRRAFVGGMMCVVAGHFNGELKDLLHSDISDLNIWVCVDDPEKVNDVITDWPEDPALYPKHAVVLGDWGMAEDRSPDSKVKNNAGGITGTFPFFAAELMLDKAINGDVVHDTCHDLEAIFWVIWITSVNMTGPYNQRRKWVDCSSTSTFPGHVRQPADAIGQNKEVPIWATPGIHPASLQEVHQFKRSILEHQFFDAMSPYWSEGESGRVFQDGMRKLRRHFAWVRLPDGTYAPPKTITHDIFVGILAEMRGSIPADEDRTTPAQVEEARERYTKMLQEADTELGTAMLEVPSFIRTGKTSTSRRSGPNGITVKKLSSSKRKAMLDVPQSSQEAKRSRASGQGTGRAEPSEAEANGSKSQITTPPQSASKGNVNRSSKPRRGRASKGRNSTSRK